ncbi:hypothetical protein QBC41DRAFT_314932 [Cercophora samala]|uniref:Uncharacterized protein n=1 Tax=Cercophora samala TaxID=330535 RepID=A0AA39ZIX2_9PEZI|nr:hypothetical protein QBC41DRAFT_314932 [Cercophora samala]
MLQSVGPYLPTFCLCIIIFGVIAEAHETKNERRRQERRRLEWEAQERRRINMDRSEEEKRREMERRESGRKERERIDKDRNMTDRLSALEHSLWEAKDRIEKLEHKKRRSVVVKTPPQTAPKDPWANIVQGEAT